MTAVEVSGLVHEYAAKRGSPARRALDGVSFAVSEGEIFGLLGPNGGGKSTLFKVLATALRPTSGSASILGEDIVRFPERARPGLGVVFQSPSLDLKLTVLENLLHGGRLYGLSGEPLRRRAGELLERFRLSDRAGDVCSSLSGGMRRRVELAKSLLHRPKILLLDEPSTGLDPSARRELWDELHALRNAGATVLATTHLMDEGERCGRVAILDRGRLVAAGAPEALKAEIGGDVLTLETDDAEALAGDIERRFGAKPEIFGSQLRLERAQAHAFIPQLVEAFPGRLRSVSMTKPSLEDAFLKHAGRRFADAEASA